MSEKPILREGRDTSEHAVIQKSMFMFILMSVAGVVMTFLPNMMEGMEQNGKWYVICGIVLAIAGIVVKAGTALGYAKSRTALKVRGIDVIKGAQAIEQEKIRFQTVAMSKQPAAKTAPEGPTAKAADTAEEGQG